MANILPWATVKYKYNSSQWITHEGRHHTPNANENDPAWNVWIYSYDSNGNITKEVGPLIGTWTNLSA